MAAVGFEPTPPKRLVPKTSALDHSATLPDSEFWVSANNKHLQFVTVDVIFFLAFQIKISNYGIKTLNNLKYTYM